MNKQAETTHKISRPPVVVVLGHVDHGKTTLLDTIRKTNVTQGEAGGITQHIGAYQITVKNGQKITFIDTPGHEAFSKMRSRGVTVADIALLVVAASDGVMPQTIEAIRHIQTARIPFIVVLNKTDLPEADPDKVKRQLAENGVLVEGYGGDVVVSPVSAKTGKGIPELLDLILLVTEMKGMTGSDNSPFEAVVIESKIDKRRGNIATLIVRNGTLHLGDTVYIPGSKAKIKALTSDTGEALKSVTPGTPVAVLGWEKIPQVGMEVSSTAQTAILTEARSTPKPFSLPPLETMKKLKVILKADTLGSLEAIKENLADGIEMVASGTGEINDSDVLLARSTGAILIGFNLTVPGTVAKLAAHEKVRIKVYTIIYELLTEIAEVIGILNTPQALEDILGKASILAEFKADEDKVAGCKILEGRLVRNDTVRVERVDTVMGQGRVKSLRQGKENVPKVEQGSECGVVFDKKLDFKIGDTIIAYKIRELLA